MTISYNLAPEPIWAIINNEGTLAGGAKMYTRRSLNKIQDKIVYQDPGGTIPYTNPIIFDLNGTNGPFYWSVDSADLSDTYYIFVNDADGNLIWDVDDFSPPSSGGGGTVTTYIPLTNYIANNQFIDHIDDMAAPENLTNTVIAPSNHKGFTPALLAPIVSTYGVVGPDIRFVKNNTGLASDQITFPLFALASAPLIGDVTPVDYLRYQCTGSPIGETFKAFQFPITQKIKNLSNQKMTFKIWSKVTTTPVTLSVGVLQYFGSGTAASAELLTPVGNIELTTIWEQYNISLTIPDVAGKSIGTPSLQTDDDALYIQLNLPLGTNCDVLFIKPKLYLGTIDPSIEFDNYDQINSINSTPRTGDVKTSFWAPTPPNGWLRMDNNSIGNVGSGATNRANADTFQLYKTLWDGVLDTWAPVSTGRGASAVADFLAGKTLTLPLSLGRALAGAGSGSGLTPRFLGENTGVETVVLTGANMPTGTPFNATTSSGNFGADIGTNHNTPGAANANPYTSGSDTPVSIMQPTSFMNVFIKL